MMMWYVNVMEEGSEKTWKSSKRCRVSKGTKSCLYQCFDVGRMVGLDFPERCASVILRGDFPA